MGPRAVLGKESFAASASLIELSARRQREGHACPDGVAIAGRSCQVDGEPPAFLMKFIAQETEPRCCAVGDPHIEVAVLIPINRGHPTRVIVEPEAGEEARVDEFVRKTVATVSDVEEEAVAFMPRQGVSGE